MLLEIKQELNFINTKMTDLYIFMYIIYICIKNYYVKKNK